MFAGYLLVAVVYIAFSEAAELSKITFLATQRNFTQQNFDVKVSVTGTGCVVDGKTHVFGSVFTVTQTGPCIQFECNPSSVNMVKSQSGCENLDHCNNNEFMVNHCTLHKCSIFDVVSGNSIKITRHMKAIAEEKCYHAGTCHPLKAHFTVKYHHHTANCLCHTVERFHCVA